jgi:CubicO group peptidase (beta-lactamase class C family)
MSGLDAARLARLGAVIDGHIERGTTGGVAWLAARDGQVEVGTHGVSTRGEDLPVQRDTVFRIASMSKPVTAVAALLLVEECTLRLEDPVDELLPELADRRVLVDGRGPIDGATVPANRPITLHDLLTFRLGWGMDFTAPWPQPLMQAASELGLGDGPPQPQGLPTPDEWIKRIGTLPLLYQPGERWLYHVGSDVLGVLIERATGQPLETVLRERMFEPLGMHDTGFSASDVSRLTTCYSGGAVWDAPDGQWAKPPTFPSAGGGLVSTIDDFAAFASMLLRGGAPLLSRSSVAAMTTNQLEPHNGGPGFDGSLGWGFGVSVSLRRTGVARSAGSYGWDGGLGSSWVNDPSEGLVGVILTTDMFAGPFPPPAVIQDFWTGTYGALA